MAIDSAGYAYHSTLGAGVDTITLTGNTADKVEVFNRGTTGDIYFTINGADPVTTGTPIKDCYIVPAGQSYEVVSVGVPDVVKLKGAANSYSITGQQVAKD